MLVEAVRDGVAEGGDGDAKRVRGSTTQRQCSLRLRSVASHCRRLCGRTREQQSTVTSDRKSSSSWGWGEQTREKEEQKKQVKRPYAACMRAESSVATGRRCSKTPKLKRATRSESTGIKRSWCASHFWKDECFGKERKGTNVAIVAISTSQILSQLAVSW